MGLLRALFLLLLLAPVNFIRAQEKIPRMGFSDFEPFLNRENDTVYVINFWATWCGPCRKELPEFEKVHLEYRHQKVKVLLVSLDFPAQIDKTLPGFLRDNHISAPVIVLDEPDANSWIDKVNPAWTGSIPATLFYKGSDRLFLEKEINYQDIIRSIHSFINL
jgi:thiol-disulfide isomerase/thioredoxin